MSETHENLLAGATVAPTLLDADPAAAGLKESAGDQEGFLAVVRAHPSLCLCWALLAQGALQVGTPEGDVAAYAYARTGYHRGLDALRRHGWKGAGPIPWEHEPNRGFLRALWALSQAAERLGETDEAQRCAQFLRDASRTGYDALAEG